MSAADLVARFAAPSPADRGDPMFWAVLDDGLAVLLDDVTAPIPTAAVGVVFVATGWAVECDPTADLIPRPSTAPGRRRCSIVYAIADDGAASSLVVGDDPPVDYLPSDGRVLEVLSAAWAARRKPRPPIPPRGR